MSWNKWQDELKKCKVILHYSSNHQLYPISDWLHPGLIPIGDGELDELFQDLPNLEWVIRHLGWLGFCNIDIISSEPLRGLDHICNRISSQLNLNFVKGFWFQQLLDSREHVETIIVVSGFSITNSDLRHAVLLHKQRENDATLLAIRGLEFQVGLVSFDEQSYNVTEFKEKPLDKTQLVNSGLLILNYKSKKIQSLLDRFSKEQSTIPIDKNTQRNDDHYHAINGLINILIEEGTLKTIELTGTKGEPWFLDISRIETWIKMDPQNFIQNFSHLYQLK